MVTSSQQTRTLLEKSIRTLEQEFEQRQAAGQRGLRPLSASVARAYRVAIEQRAAELQRLQDKE